jgi:hypothetical protein
MNPQDLVSLLGLRQDDPLVESALRIFSVRRRPHIVVDDEDADGPVVEKQAWVKNSHLGIEFGFDDEGAWKGLDETAFGQGPMLLTQIYLYGLHQGVDPYPDEVPFGLRMRDDKPTVRRRMLAFESTRRSHIRDTWDTMGCRVTVAYTADESAIEFIVCMLREPPLRPLSYELAAAPRVATLSQLLGHSLEELEVRSALDPLGLQDRVEDIQDAGRAEFPVHGLSVDFALGGRRSVPVISGMTFYRERESGSRQWTGGLPHDIAFEDSLDRIAEKMGRTADEEEDEDFVSYAVWHETDLTIHVLYNSMENRVARVSVYAPGVWRRMEGAD